MDVSATFPVAMLDVRMIPELLRQRGKSQADLARYLELDPSSLIKTIKGTRQLKASEMVKIEAFLADGDDQPPAKMSMDNRAASGRNRQVRVFGYAAAGGLAGDDRIAMRANDIVEWIEAPPAWKGPGELVAVRIFGAKMSPRLFEGETVFAQLNLPPVPGRDVLIEFEDGTGLVRTYSAQRDGVVFCRTWSPDAEERYDGMKVRLHAITWRR